MVPEIIIGSPLPTLPELDSAVMNEFAAKAGPVIPKVIIEIANSVNAKTLVTFIFIFFHGL